MKINRRRKSRRWSFLLVTLVLLGSYSYWALQKPLPPLKPLAVSVVPATQPVGSNLAWPAASQSAVGIMGTDIMETQGTQTPAPIASVAKVITALVVLEKKPLNPKQSGPTITLTQADVDIFGRYLAQDSSLVPVAAGAQFTEYQMLQAIMLPSANNIADTLAIWAYGSLDAYHEAANAYLAKNGLINTRVGDDASGLSPATTSNALDLVKLGKLAMDEPVLAEIVGQSSATGLPLSPTVNNVNGLLGIANIVGVKTGNTEQAGGVFVSASRVLIDNEPVVIVTSVVGAKDLIAALKGTVPLVQSAQANFSESTVLKAGTVAGYYDVPWGESIPAITSQDLKTTSWKGSSVKRKFELKTIGINDTVAGAAKASGVTEKSVPVTLKSQPSEPTIWWRLTHPHK